MTHAEAGALGGIIRAERLSHERMSEIGKLGGRPRLPTLSELLASQPLRVNTLQGNITKNTAKDISRDLRKLKRLWQTKLHEMTTN
jgi:hypothetical protein